jgi:uncharacterized protein (TIGR00725 family)
MAPQPAAKRRPIVAVVGGGDPAVPAAAVARAESIGRLIAGAGAHLLTGGGDGIMAAACRGFVAVRHAGQSIGILPAGRPPERYPNSWVEIPIRTHLQGSDPHGADSRNPINVLSCDAMVALTGEAGTRAELELALRRVPPLPLVVLLVGRERIGGLDRAAVQALGAPVVRSAAAVAAFLDRELDPQLPLRRPRAATGSSR